jgi:Icc protein
VIGSSARPLRVIQVSDCHVPQNPGTPYRGLSADRNLVSLLPAMRHWQPDLVLLTGDVSEDGSPASYGRVSAHLSTVGAPVLALPGNHDDAAVMRRFFPVGPWDGPHGAKERNWQLVLLNSTVPGEVAGRVSPEALDRLDHMLRESTASHALVALHHQPVPMEAEWIDRYALQQPEALLTLLDGHPKVRCVTWGHVHQEFEARRNGMLLLGSPSTVANSLPGTEKFSLDLAGPACRWLELGLDGTVSTGLMRAGSRL